MPPEGVGLSRPTSTHSNVLLWPLLSPPNLCQAQWLPYHPYQCCQCCQCCSRSRRCQRALRRHLERAGVYPVVAAAAAAAAA
eukprot:8710887-Alexandrium_andersonii.AAC.1